MKAHRTSRRIKIASRRHLFPLFLACCSLGGGKCLAQQFLPASGMHIGIDWHTVADPRYGASYDYAWNDVHVRSRDGGALPNQIELEMSRYEGGGLFYLTSTPITVPISGMIITFGSHVVMHPSDAERGTSLSDDPNAGCKRFDDGISRASYHQVISILDVQTEKTLAPAISDHHFDITRFQVLNDIDRTDDIIIDLSAFAGKQVKIQTIVLAGYNGRGPSRSTKPLFTVTPSIQRDLR